MKKIIHFSLANTKGGITQYVLNNWKHINKTKFQFDIVTFGGKLDFQEYLEAQGCKVFYVKSRAEDNLDKFRDEILRIFSRKYDAVHLHTSYWKTFELEKLARQAEIPRIIVHSHNTAVFDDNGREEKESQHYRMIERLTPDIATDFWACSKAAANWLYGNKIPENQITILKNAIDTDEFSYKEQVRRQYRKKLGWENKFIIGHVGRFSYQKNHEFLLNMFRKLVSTNEEVRLLFIGRGPLEDKIQFMIDEYGLSERVCLAGVRSDVNNWIQAMDLFCLPSRFEGFPIVAVEAQTAGVPLILSDTITREVNLTGNVSYISLDIEAWMNEIRLRIYEYSEKDICKRLINKTILKEQGYDIKDSVKELERLYDIGS